MKALTFGKYRIINIAIISVIFVIAEVVVSKAFNSWLPDSIYVMPVSLSVVFISLEMMRWQGWGIIAALVSGLSFCIANNANWQQILVYCIGNLAALLALVFLKLIGYGKVKKDFMLTVLYIMLVYVLIQLGRWGVSCALGNDPKLLLQFLSKDALSGFFGIVVVSILRNADGMFENQKDYLLRLEEEKKKEQKSEEFYYENQSK